MICANKCNIKPIVDSLICGQFKQAKEFLQHKCKTKPEKQAYRLAQVIGAMTDPANEYYEPELAARFLNCFDIQ